MRYIEIKIWVVLYFLFLTLVNCHVRFTYPTPRSQDPGIKSYPCGPFGFWQNPNIYTVMSPGLTTIELTETINHHGSPFRIALSYDSDDHYSELVLLDHIPHYDPGSSPKNYYIDVVIPDVNCPRCGLQVVNPMTDKISSGSCCDYPVGPNKCSSVYHSCANIVINGSQNLQDWVEGYEYHGPCGPYTQESGANAWYPYLDGWKYDPNQQGSFATSCDGFQLNCNGNPTSSTGNPTSSTGSTNSNQTATGSTNGNQTTTGTTSAGRSKQTAYVIVAILVLLVIALTVVVAVVCTRKKSSEPNYFT